MSMLVPPQMLNTMAPTSAPGEPGFTEAFYADPVRRYMIPVFSDRRTDWPSHPYAQRDSLHEAEMWAVEGLTHRYPTKVLAELLPTCPQYCGHCTRMDLVGNPTPVTDKHKFALAREDRLGCHALLPAPHAQTSATSWSPAGTSPTCPGRGWSRSCRRSSRSTRSGTSGWPARR